MYTDKHLMNGISVTPINIYQIHYVNIRNIFLYNIDCCKMIQIQKTNITKNNNF